MRDTMLPIEITDDSGNSFLLTDFQQVLELKLKLEKTNIQSMRIIKKQKKEIDGLRFFKQVFNMPIEEVNELLSHYDR